MTAVLATTNRGEAAVNALLTADHVDIAYSPKQPPVVRGVSLTVHPGSTIGIVGESGSGKTTLARALAGLITPTAGEVRVDGVPWQRVGGRSSARRKVQMIFQDPYGSLNPGLTALATVAEVFRAVRRLPAAEARQQAGDLLSEVGLTPEAQRRRAAGLSGGQCQRVGIARALACEPSVLIADEPTSALDVSVQAQILNLLDDLRETRGLAVVLVSHDLGVVRHATAETIVMHHGVVVEQGPTDEILSAPKDAYTQELLASLPENW